MSTATSAFNIAINAQDAATPVFSRIKAGAANLATNLKTNLGGGIASLGAGIARFAAPIAGIAGAAAIAKSGLASLAKDDAAIQSLKTISATADEARARLAAISAQRFKWASIPTDDLVAAEITLGKFTQNAWAGMDALQTVGDIAAGTGQSVTTVADQMARAYAEIQSGQGGRGLTSLANAGLITPGDLKNLQEMVKSGKDSQTIWDGLIARMGKYKGAMEAANASSAAQMNRLNTAWEDLKKTVMEPLVPLLGEGLTRLQGILQSLAPVATEFANRIKAVMDVIRAGVATDTLGTSILKSLVFGFGKSIAVWTTMLGENIIFTAKLFGAALVAAVQSGLNATLGAIPKIGELLGLSDSGFNFGENFGKISKDWGLTDKRGNLAINRDASGIIGDFFDKQWGDTKREYGVVEPPPPTTQSIAAAATAAIANMPADNKAAVWSRVTGDAPAKPSRDPLTAERHTNDLARRGLFLPGYNPVTPALNYARSTADHARQTTHLLKQIHQTLTRRGASELTLA